MNASNGRFPRLLATALLCLPATIVVAPTLASAAEGPRQGMPRMEAQREPRGYTRFERPRGADQRPPAFDRAYFGHNFQARQTFRIGPYHAPPGYAYRRWAYGEILPAPFWVQDYWISDFWLFGLDVPPVGYEWVRYGPDALLVSTSDGEIGQVVYGTFL